MMLTKSTVPFSFPVGGGHIQVMMTAWKHDVVATLQV